MTPYLPADAKAPYLSVVVTARNDDHGGNLLGRMQAFVNGLMAHCDQHRLPTELIVVEWNPPEDRPRLSRALLWPPESQFCAVRIIEVPPDVHGRFRHARSLPLYQWIAKNVGIRRARGEYVLVTNIDILFSGELFGFLSTRRLEADKMYRIDRWDALADVPVAASPDEQDAYCRSHLIRVNAREGTFSLTSDGQRKVRAVGHSKQPSRLPSLLAEVSWQVSDPNCPVAKHSPDESPSSRSWQRLFPPRKRRSKIDLMHGEHGAIWAVGWYPLEHFRGETFRWMELQASLVLMSDSNTTELIMEAEPGPAVGFKPVRLEVRDQAGATLTEVEVRRRKRVFVPLPGIKSLCALSMSVRSNGTPTSVVGDTREMAVRLFRCEVVTKPVRTADQTMIGEAFPGVWYSRGCVRLRREDSVMILISSEAELIVEPPSDSDCFLSLELQSIPQAPSMPILLVIREPEGRILCQVQLSHKHRIQLPRQFRSKNLSILHLEVLDANGQSGPWVLMTASRWIGRPETDDRKHPPVVNGIVQLHTNSAGDFTLMARHQWMKLRGYPEFDLFSMHVDSLLCWIAYHSGLHEEVLQDPLRIYHIEHAIGSGWTPEGSQQLIERTHSVGLRWLSADDVLQCARFMNAYDTPMSFNGEDWGLAREVLQEESPFHASEDSQSRRTAANAG